jgi:hypothetical protein
MALQLPYHRLKGFDDGPRTNIYVALFGFRRNLQIKMVGVISSGLHSSLSCVCVGRNSLKSGDGHVDSK